MAPHAEDTLKATSSPVAEAVPALTLAPEMFGPPQTTEHENEWYSAFKTFYEINESVLHTPQPIYIVIIEAGAAGPKHRIQSVPTVS